jgi:hypothetical protein
MVLNGFKQDSDTLRPCWVLWQTGWRKVRMEAEAYEGEVVVVQVSNDGYLNWRKVPLELERGERLMMYFRGRIYRLS